jgi:hypothetical protein
MDLFGFIITRHVNSEKTNMYWNRCVKCIKTFYPYKKIIIIDDNSNEQFLKADVDYINVTTIQSEFKGRGELLAYYYYIKNKFFENAVIVHDSVFFHKRVNFERLIGINVIPLWHFYSDKENITNTVRISNVLKNIGDVQKKLTHNDFAIGLSHLKWYGCFGAQTFINHNFLNLLENKYNLMNMINSVFCRADRCCLERILGCIFFAENPKITASKSLFGNIMEYHKWGYTFEQYENDLKKNRVPRYVVKVWTGR